MLPIEFNSRKFSFVRYVFVEIFGLLGMTKMTPKMTKIQKFPNFQRFYAIFVKLLTDFVDWIVEKSEQGTSSLSSSVLWRDNCGFQVEKYLKVAPKKTKNTKFSNFQSFYAVVVKFMTDFVDWNVRKGQQGKSLLSSSLLWRDCSFLKMTPKMRKTQNFQFPMFLCSFCQIIDRPRGLEW